MAAKQQRVFAFINATILDGTCDMEPQRGMSVLVDKGRIVRIEPAATAQLPAEAEVIDLHDSYLLPGLINMHVHFCGSGKPVSAGNAGDLMRRLDNAPGRMIVRHILKRSAQQQLASGVTCVRGAGDPLYADIAVRDAINAGRYLGPRIVAPGTGITVPNGHGAGLFAQVATTPQEASDYVCDLSARGADTIKLFVTGGVFDAEVPGEPGVLRMSLEVARAACKTAHDLGLPVMAHVESTEGVKVALQAPALPFVLLDPEKTASTEVQKLNGDIVCEGIIKCAREALDAGIPVGLGTDSSCPYVTQYDMWREVAYFAKYVGVSTTFALHTATQVNAELLGLGAETGTIEVGKAADIIVCRNNPLEDLSRLSHLEHVMCRGVLADGLKVKHMPKLDEDLDWIMAQPATVRSCGSLSLATVLSERCR